MDSDAEPINASQLRRRLRERERLTTAVRTELGRRALQTRDRHARLRAEAEQASRDVAVVLAAAVATYGTVGDVVDLLGVPKREVDRAVRTASADEARALVQEVTAQMRQRRTARRPAAADAALPAEDGSSGVVEP